MIAFDGPEAHTLHGRRAVLYQPEWKPMLYSLCTVLRRFSAFIARNSEKKIQPFLISPHGVEGSLSVGPVVGRRGCAKKNAD